MASRLLQRVGTSLAVPALVVGAFALADPSHTHSTSSKASSTLNLSTKDTELSASTWYLAHWDVDASGRATPTRSATCGPSSTRTAVTG